MGLGLAMVLIFVFTLLMGFMVVQAMFAARKWRDVIADGDREALSDQLENTFEAWRNSRPPRGMPPVDWRALHTAAIVAADRDRGRVSLIADPDVRVIAGSRVEVGSIATVARRAAVRMAERLFYDVPYVQFREVQVDVYTEYRTPGGASESMCVLSARATRATVTGVDWDAEIDDLLSDWQVAEAHGDVGVDPDADALISEAEVAAVRAAEEALRGTPERDRHS